MERISARLFVLLAALQIAHQASITNDDTLNLNKMLHKISTFNSGSRGVLTSYYQNTVQADQEEISKQASFKNNQINPAFLRSKRQIEQDANSNDDLFLDESETISPEKLVEVTTLDDGLVDDNRAEQEDKHSWDEDSDENNKNQLTEIKNEEKEGRENHPSNEKDGTEDSRPEDVESSILTAPIMMSDEAVKISDSPHEADNEQAERGIAGSETDVEVENGSNMKNSDEEDNISANDEANPKMEKQDYEDESGSSNTFNHSKETNIIKETNLYDNKLSIETDKDDAFSNVGAVEDIDETEIDNINGDDVDTFLPLKPLNDQSSLAQLKKSVDSDDDDEEGSGGIDLDLATTDSEETDENDKNNRKNTNDQALSLNASSKIELRKLHIDDNSNNGNTERDKIEDGDEDYVDDYEDENDASETVEKTPITVPKDNSSANNDRADSYGFSKESSVDLLESSTTNVVDPSYTYDPLKVIDPLGFDNPPNMMEAFGLDKVFGPIDISAEGSGSDDEEPTDSLETDQVFKVSTEKVESTTTQMDTNEPLINKTRTYQVNSAQIKKGDENGVTILMPTNNNPSEVNHPINEMGVNKGEKEPVKSTEEEKPTSSTGSFIVLGAIMATIVVLLGYSVVKSQRQKRKALRRPPPSDIDTEMNEIDTFLPGKNGHGPGGKLIDEGEKLLSPNTDEEKNGLKGDSIPIYRNGIHPDTGIAGVHTPNALNVGLSEIKVEDPQKLTQEMFSNTQAPNPDDMAIVKPVINSSNSSVPFTNGYSPTDPLDNSTSGHQPDEKDLPKTDERGSWVYGDKPETATIKLFIDHDSIPKTPVLIVKRGSSDMDM